LALGDLVAAIDRLPAIAYHGAAFRHVAPGRPPLSGTGARINGGRWNPPDSFVTLYLGLARSTVIEEFRRSAAKQGLAPDAFLPRDFYGYEVQLTALLDLRAPDHRETLHLLEGDITSDDLRATQLIGEAAYIAGREGVLAPSAAGEGHVLAVYLDRLQSGSLVRHVSREVWRVETLH